MFKVLAGIAAALHVLDEALVQYGYMRNSGDPNPKRTYKQVDVKVVLDAEEVEGWDRASIDGKVAAFRRGLQRQQFRERVENTG